MPERKRMPIRIEDILEVRELSQILWERLESEIPSWNKDYLDIVWVHTESGEFPKRIIFQDRFQKTYSVIVSELGSLTLRPEFGKKQAIFYMSIGKYGAGEYFWEDGEGNEIREEEIPERFQRSIQKSREYDFLIE